MEENIEKKLMTKEEFIEEFIKCLESGKNFLLYDKIVEGDISVRDIYKKIYERIKENENKILKLKEDKLKDIIEIKDNEIIVNINIEIKINNVIFKGKFEMYHQLGETSIKVSFNKDVYFQLTQNIVFERDVDFSYAIFKGNVDFWKAVFNGNANFLKTKFKGDAFFERAEFKKYSDFREAYFEGVANFWNAKFKMRANFSGVVFKNLAYFEGVKFIERAYFVRSVFKEDVDFNSSTFNIAIFEKSTFNSIAKFSDISFNFLCFREVIFKGIVLFKKKEKDKDKEIAIFNLVNFKKPDYTTFIDFPLSKTSFLLTNVKDITIIAKAEKILSEYLLEKDNKDNINENLCKKAIDILKPYLREEMILKEYRNIRNSFEKNRTFIEASELFIYEMDLIRRTTTFDDRKVIEKINECINIWYIYAYFPHILLFEFWISIKTESNPIIIFLATLFVVILHIGRKYISKILKYISKILTWIVFWIYKLTSNYGESIVKPIIITIFVILAIPCIITHNLNPFSNELLLEQTLRAFFQLGIDKTVIGNNKELEILVSYEWLIRIISLILLGSLFIAIKRKLERK